MAVLTNAIYEASYIFTESGNRGKPLTKYSQKISQQSYAFIRGTGLDIMIEEYNIDYNPELIRNYFMERFGND